MRLYELLLTLTLTCRQAGCSREKETEAWCKQTKEKPKVDRTVNKDRN